MDEDYQPLQFPPLIKDAWVFCLYGVVVSAFMDVYDRKGASLEGIKSFMLEPFSIKAFFSITFIGFILVTLVSIILGMDEVKARKSKFMRYFCVPISEVGMSAGFIVIGMSSGISAYFHLFGNGDVDANMAGVNLKLSLMVLFIIIPIYFQQRSLFLVDKKESFVLSLIMTLYVVIVYGAILYSDPEHFFWLSVFTIVFFILLWIGKVWVNKKNKPTQ